MMKNGLILLVSLLFLLLTGCGETDSAVKINDLQLEMKHNPEGIDMQQPRFSWQLTSKVPDLQQKAYRIQVALSDDALKAEKELVWDSGEVESDASILIPYKGGKLESERTYFWRVKLVTNQGETAWSRVARWSMTQMDNAKWMAEWIGEKGTCNPGETVGREPNNNKTRLAARYLRKEFTTPKKVKRAMLYISGLGVSETYLNGKRVSEDVFAPMPSLYTKTVYYNVYDVTSLLRKKTNTLGVVLGNGRYFSMRDPGMISFGFPCLWAELHLEYKDGSTGKVVTDTSWKVTSKGPIVANNEFDGEHYDARLEIPDWYINGFDDSSWKVADLMEAPKGKLTAQQNPNIRVQDIVKPVSVTRRQNGSYIVDMGQNMVGWLQVQLEGKKNQPVTMIFAEVLNEDGSLYRANLRSAEATDVYIPSRDGRFVWEPSFVYHGFRYVEIVGVEEQPELESLTGKVIYDEMKTTGHFKTSHPLVTQIHQNAYWGVRGNYRGMPTDCPQRDERLGWLGDRATGAYGESFLFNNALLYNKWLNDIEESMDAEGRISDVCPRFWTIYSENVTWPSAFFYAADMLYHQYGDDRAIKSHYPAMKKWVSFMKEHVLKDYIIQKDQYGDWCMPPETQKLIHSKDPSRKTDGRILGTSFYYDILNKMKMFAKIHGAEDDIPLYEELAGKVKEAYNKAFFNEETAQYGNNTVTANIISLRLGLVPEGFEDKVFKNIVEKTQTDFNGHVSAGVIGIQHLMRGLTENGRLDLAYQILTNETYPSWGYMIRHGATTIWELWNGDTADPAMNSGNHVMLLGDLIIWYYENLAGIKCAEGTQAYKRMTMKPVFPEGLDRIQASYQSVYGKIESAWMNKDGQFEWNITIPGNTSAVVYIPKSFGVKVETVPGIRKLSDDKENIRVEVGSGTYQFKNK